MKQKIYEYFGNKVVLTELEGKTNIVTLQNSAANILHEFFIQSQNENMDDNKLHFIEAAAKLIKCDIRSLTKEDKTIYPDLLREQSVRRHR